MATWLNGTASGEYFNKWGNEIGDSGKLDKTKLIKGPGGLFISDAAKAFSDLFKAAKAVGIILGTSGAYRPYTDQVSLKLAKPTLAATPGTSNHGWGRALDINDNGKGMQYNSRAYRWLLNNAHKFNIIAPPWAMEDAPKGKKEPWHWEYIGNGSSTQINIAVLGTSDTDSNLATNRNTNTNANTNANSQTNVESAPPGLDLQLEYASINAFLLTGQSISDASTGNKLKSQVNEKEEDQTIKTLTSPTHRIDPIISGTG
jgi:hypothetical protein